MKKVLLMIFLSLCLSGCFSSVNLPKTNNLANSTSNRKLSYNDLIFLSDIYSKSNICSSNEKIVNVQKWRNFYVKLDKYVKLNLDEKSKNDLTNASITRVMILILDVKHIPITVQNSEKYYHLIKNDISAQLEVLAMVIQKYPNMCTNKNLQTLEKQFKQFVKSHP